MKKWRLKRFLACWEIIFRQKKKTIGDRTLLCHTPTRATAAAADVVAAVAVVADIFCLGSSLRARLSDISARGARHRIIISLEVKTLFVRNCLFEYSQQ